MNEQQTTPQPYYTFFYLNADGTTHHPYHAAPRLTIGEWQAADGEYTFDYSTNPFHPWCNLHYLSQDEIAVLAEVKVEGKEGNWPYNFYNLEKLSIVRAYKWTYTDDQFLADFPSFDEEENKALILARILLLEEIKG